MKCHLQVKTRVKNVKGVKEGKDPPVLGSRRIKRSGLEAVKLHLQTTGDTGRTSRSATSVRCQIFQLLSL